MDGLDRRGLLRLLAGVGAAGVTGGLTACAASKAEAPRSTLRIGLLVPATGVYKDIGADLENGFKLYLSQRGDTLSGHPINLIIADEGDTVEHGTAALEELHKQNVAAVVGVANPDLLPAVRDMVEKSRIPLIAAHGSSSEMSSAVYIWQTAYLNNEPGRAIGLHLKGQEVALVGLQDTFGKDVMSGFREEHGEGSPTIWVPPTDKPDKSHLSGAVQAVLNSSPSAVFCSLPANYLVPFVEGLRDSGGDQQIYGPGTISEGLALEQLGSARGLFTAMQYSADLNNASNRAFSSVYQASFSRPPTAYAVAAYDAGFVLERAIALVDSETVTPQRINLEIAKIGQITSPRGNWQFTQGRTPQQRWYLRQVRLDGPILSNVLVRELTTLP